MASEKYSRDFKLTAIVRYKYNGNNANKTAKDIGIPVSTLREWIADKELVEESENLDPGKLLPIHIKQKIEEQILAMLDKTDDLIKSDKVKLSEVTTSLKGHLNILNIVNPEVQKTEEVKELPEEVINNNIEKMADMYMTTIKEENKNNE